MIGRYSNNQYMRELRKPCKDMAGVIAALKAQQDLRGGKVPSTDAILQVADAVLDQMATKSSAVVMVLQRTYRLTIVEVTVGHVANYVVLTTGYVLEILGFRITPTKMLQTLLHCISITDVARGLVLIPESLKNEFRKNNPVQFALFGDAAVAAALSASMRKLLEGEEKSHAVGDNGNADNGVGVDEKNDEGPPAVERVGVEELTPPPVKISGDGRKKKTRRRRDKYDGEDLDVRLSLDGQMEAAS